MTIWLEMALFIGLLMGYVSLRSQLAGKAIYILPTIGLALIYMGYQIGANPTLRPQFGLRLDNLASASIQASAAFLLLATIILIYAHYKGLLPPPPSFYYLLVFYPFWGLAQQFLFQAFFFNHLRQVGLPPMFAILVTAIVYALAHLPTVELVPLCFIWGLIASTLFWLKPNLIPLGVVHGLLGAMVYAFILEKDIWQTFHQSLTIKRKI